MTDNDKICYKILDFLRTVKGDVNITDEILRYKFPNIEDEKYNSAINQLVSKNAIDKNSPNRQWQITEPIGESVLNTLVRLNPSNIREIISGGMPEPLSIIFTSRFLASHIVSIVNSPSFGRAKIALSIIFVQTWFSSPT